MNTYDDNDPNRGMVPIQPIQAPSNPGLMDYVRNNKLAVAIVILILIGLIWWFCIRKNGNKDSGLHSSAGKNTIAINRSRGLGSGSGSNLY